MLRLTKEQAQKIGILKEGMYADNKKNIADKNGSHNGSAALREFMTGDKTAHGHSLSSRRSVDLADNNNLQNAITKAMPHTPNFLLRLMSYKMPRCDLGPEDKEAKAFSDTLRAMTLEGNLKAVWWHTASELAGGKGKRVQIRYAIAKALGLIPGSPDYVFLDAKKGGFAIEMKAKSKGILTSNQKDFKDWCNMAGIPYAKTNGCEEAIEQLKEWGLIENK